MITIDEKTTSTVIGALVLKIRDLETDIYLKDMEIKRLREELRGAQNGDKQ